MEQNCSKVGHGQPLRRAVGRRSVSLDNERGLFEFGHRETMSRYIEWCLVTREASACRRRGCFPMAGGKSNRALSSFFVNSAVPRPISADV